MHISGCSDGAKAFSNTTIEDSYLAGFYRVDGESHNDAIQSSGGSNIVIRRNTVLGPYQIVHRRHHLAGRPERTEQRACRRQLPVGGQLHHLHQRQGAGASNIRVINNVIERDGWLYGWKSTNTSPLSTLAIPCARRVEPASTMGLSVAEIRLQPRKL